MAIDQRVEAEHRLPEWAGEALVCGTPGPARQINPHESPSPKALKRHHSRFRVPDIA